MKFSCVYIEEEVVNTQRVQEILQRLPPTPQVTIKRYGEVFNRRSQNFRLQKQKPALILAKKHGNLVLPAPTGYGFNDNPGFYFSHMLNCVYDCRYCFLQGMYRSANYVLFTNYEDFATQLQIKTHGQSVNPVFYSGYDCDSMALEPVSHFAEFFVDWFADNPAATLELRTKSTQLRSLYNRQPVSNCIIAMSFTPKDIYRRWESKVPGIEKRLDALKKLQEQGWPVAIRLEPLIYESDFENSYDQLLSDIFEKIDGNRIHSISTGMFRMPKTFFKNISNLYPDELLYARKYEQSHGMIAQSSTQEAEMLESIEDMLCRYVPIKHYYRCA
ncbi:MAG: DNA photolyase [Gammaproteobacteria bacterium]|nr:DNA photolyase [Gammaproteobacteria bacterium]